ncbi:MAG: LPS export ABC transporter permease LptF [Steroidobacteraceae bacterium]
MLRILDRYVLREVAVTWVAVTGVLLVILMFSQLAQVLGQAAAGGFPRSTILSLLALTALQNLSVLIPIGLFLAIMLSLGRLYQESEMAAMQACGIGIVRLYLPIGLFALGIVAFLGWLAFLGAPTAAARVQEIRTDAVRQAQFGSLEPGRFRSFAGGQIVFYAERVDADGMLHNVFVERHTSEKSEIVTAARAEQRGVGEAEQTFILYDGERYEGIPGGGEFRMIHFAEHGIPIRLPGQAAGASRREQHSTSDLWRSADLGDQAELHWRLSIPLMTFVLMLLAVPLARLRPRQGRYGRMGLGILVYFAYANLLAAGRVWIEKETIPSVLGMWWVHAGMLAVVVFLLWREYPGMRWLPSRRAAA